MKHKATYWSEFIKRHPLAKNITICTDNKQWGLLFEEKGEEIFLPIIQPGNPDPINNEILQYVQESISTPLGLSWLSPADRVLCLN